MKTLLFFVLSAVLCSFCTANMSELVERPTLPLLVWSGKQMFSLHNEQLLQTLTDDDVQGALLSLLGGSQDSFLNTLNGLPEAIVMFVEPEMQTEDVSYFASAYDVKPQGGAFSTLKRIVESSPSSVVAPYVSSGFQASFADNLLVRVADKMTKGSIVLVRDAGVPFLHSLNRHYGVKNVPLADFNGDSEVFTNGEVDLVVVCLSRASTSEHFVAHNTLIERLTGVVSTATNGNFVGMYTANAATSVLVRNFPNPNGFLERPITSDYAQYYFVNNGTNNTNNTNTTSEPRTYLTGAILETFMVVLTLLAMVFIGICNLCSLQVPEQYEAPKAVVKM